MKNDRGVNPFFLGNIVRATRKQLIGNLDNRHGIKRLAALPWLNLVNADCFFRPIRDPVFIIGAPRSGTTFLGSCFDAVETIQYFHEPASIKCAAAKVYLDRSSWHSMARYYGFQYRWLMASQPGRARRLADKTPRHCFLVDFLAGSFPNAKFVFIVRNGADSAYSNSLKHWLDSALDGSGKKDHAGYLLGSRPQFWTEPNRLEEFSQASNLRRCAWAWRRYNEEALRSLDQLQGDRQIRIRYEDMAMNPRDAADKIACFLGFNRKERGQFEKQMFRVQPNSIGKAAQSLDFDQLQEVKTECGDLLCQLNYR